MRKTRTCLYCGCLNDSASIFCSRCNLKLEPDPVAQEELKKIEERKKIEKEKWRAQKILIIDDEKSLVMAIGDLLKEHQYDVVTAYDGLEGLEVARRERPNLMIVDLLMPKMSGYDFLRHLREQTGFETVPVIILSARGDMKDFFEPWEFQVFLNKPVDLDQLLLTVDDLLRPRFI
ncbi:MAG TPA: response regulator [Candidatus Omnitrophota bacterium]|nr:response regulator [Candidatus Omnitrophota bacterium]